jgi:hypothetical protein
MKRSILDITQTISRNPKSTRLTPYNLTDSTYWIFEAKGWRFKSILREIELRTTQDRINLRINTQSVTPRDYLIEEGSTGLLFKFIKDRFEYDLDLGDYIEVKGDIEQYA